MVKRGIFSNGVPYLRFGEGKKVLLIFSGGPGNYLASPMYKEFNFLAKQYTLFMFARKSSLPKNYSTKDMAEDYARVIEDEFNGGPVDVIGESYGGLIAQYLAANHPKLIRRLVLLMSTYRFSQEGTKLDMQFAELASQGKTRAAFRSLAPMLSGNRIKRSLFSFFMSLFASRMFSNPNPEDLIVEGRAEVAHNSKNQLPRIVVPTLVVAGDRDFFCSTELLHETATGIPDAKLIIYEGKGHESLGKQFHRDVSAFLGC
ncbi:MAG: alpha/beta hydrolase [Candidatus Bathyarchaeota archaeon]|nr:alpha/beta hydrolase [Candidatus Bathyarchaeota archaeon]